MVACHVRVYGCPVTLNKLTDSHKTSYERHVITGHHIFVLRGGVT